MSTPQPPPGEDHPEPQDPDFVQLINVLHAAAERARAAKSAALHEWSQEQTAEEILADYGLDIDALREDP